MNKKFDKLGFYPADILLPKGQDMNKWAVVACDQFTSEPEYWQAVEKKVGDAPSTLRLILPEANLKAPNVDEYIENINNAMKKYLADGVFETLTDSLIYIERQQSDGKIRHGLIGMVDLDAYDFTPGSGALIRATEGTVLDRIPPRAKVRRNAPIELPHVMLLIDDPDKTVIEPLTAAAEGMEKVYDFDLMQDGGHIRGFKLSDKQIDAVANALEGLTTDEAMQKKYNVSGVAPLLFAVGDGNHSLATAKACYEEQKKGSSSPSTGCCSAWITRSSWTPSTPPIPTPMRARATATPSSSCGTARATLSLCLTPRCSWRWVRYRALLTST